MLASPVKMAVHVHDYAGHDDARKSTVDVEAQEDAQSPKLERAATASSSIHGSSNHDFIRRRTKRANTAKTYHRDGAPQTSNWQSGEPGEEPGLDPTQPDLRSYLSLGDLPPEKAINERCDITVVDFSQDDMRMYRLDNDTLEEFLEKEREPWVVCRWINVNGLSWDAVRLLANHKMMHRLAIEDLMHNVNRTKADWYSDHLFVVLSMQKLIKLRSDESEAGSEASSDSEDEYCEAKSISGESIRQRRLLKKKKNHTYDVILSALKDFLSTATRKKKNNQSNGKSGLNKTSGSGSHLSSGDSIIESGKLRTLQRFQGGPNEDRIDFMERHASLSHMGLGVAIEQVSIFLHADNTVTSFFEASADDIETPIVRRLGSPGTILRQCCDASMLLQAILDAITDLAIPVTTAYQDAIGDLELEVLTDPDIDQSTSLYILTSEITVLRKAIQPIIGIINSLRDHKSAPPKNKTTRATSSNFFPSTAPGSFTNLASDQANHSEGVSMASTVTISAMCHIYLGDVLDHCITITEGYDQMRRSADNMIALIFNTIGTCWHPPYSLPLTCRLGRRRGALLPVNLYPLNSSPWYIQAPIKTRA